MIVFFCYLVDGTETLLDTHSAWLVHGVSFLPDGIKRADAKLLHLSFEWRTILPLLLFVLDTLLPLRVSYRPLHARRQLFVLSWLGSLGLQRNLDQGALQGFLFLLDCLFILFLALLLLETERRSPLSIVLAVLLFLTFVICFWLRHLDPHFLLFWSLHKNFFLLGCSREASLNLPKFFLGELLGEDVVLKHELFLVVVLLVSGLVEDAQDIEVFLVQVDPLPLQILIDLLLFLLYRLALPIDFLNDYFDEVLLTGSERFHLFKGFVELALASRHLEALNHLIVILILLFL
mmetsp:Transcript_31107/g.30561  ORF Transcript_31107/g.30561 Transcript_31107/m.30561 type:complete len:291 (-) Transcript_31107:253-1125(-)